MSGTSANASVWTDADVYVGTTSTPAPTNVTTALNAGFLAVGLLDGEAGFSESREDDVTDFYAWGGVLVTTTRSKHKRQFTFSVLEDNATTFALINPGSTRSVVSTLTTNTVKKPTNPTVSLVLQMTDGVKTKRRYIKQAKVDSIGEIKEAEGEMTAYEVTVTIIPENDGTLYKEFVE